MISAGHNHEEIHSEIDAISNIKTTSRRGSIQEMEEQIAKMAGTTLINVMLTRAGRFGISRPCDKCMSYLRTMKVHKVTFYNGVDWVTERV